LEDDIFDAQFVDWFVENKSKRFNMAQCNNHDCVRKHGDLIRTDKPTKIHRFRWSECI